MERGQASKFEERGIHMVRWRCYVCLTLRGSVPSSCQGLGVIGYSAAVLSDKVSAWWAERTAFTFWVWPRWWLSVLWMCCQGCAPGDCVKSCRKGSTLRQSSAISPPFAAGSLLLLLYSLASQLFFFLFHVKRGNQRETKIICPLGWRYGLKFCCLFSENGPVQCSDITGACQ